MSVGARRERVRFVRKSRTQRVDGGYDTADVTLFERWAAVKPVRANESEEAGRKRGAVLYLLELDGRGTESATTDDKIVWLTRGNTVLNIREIRTDIRRELPLIIMAESGVINSGE